MNIKKYLPILLLCSSTGLYTMSKKSVIKKPDEIDFVFYDMEKNQTFIDARKQLYKLLGIRKPKNDFIVLNEHTDPKAYQLFLKINAIAVYKNINQYYKDQDNISKDTLQKLLDNLKNLQKNLSHIKGIKRNITPIINQLNNVLFQNYYEPLHTSYEKCAYDYKQVDTFIEKNTKLKLYRCKECKHLCTDRRNARRHVVALHLNRKLFKCNLCKRSFSYSQQLKEHQEKNTCTKKRKRSEVFVKTEESNEEENKYEIVERSTDSMTLRPKRRKKE